VTDLYFCPTAREMEIHPGGGFTVCCDRPELHIPVTNGPTIPATVQLLDELKRADYQAVQRLAALEADGDRLARTADDLARTLATVHQRAEKAEAAIERVRTIHHHVECSNVRCKTGGWCAGCDPRADDNCSENPWPCLTIQALEAQ
jgi:hypothetical protein